MPAPRVRFPLGHSDFRNVREGGFRYVDKSRLIEDVIATGAQALLIPRPRRFGKTLNLSMLRYFLQKSAEDRSHLFAGLAVDSSEIARPHRQRYPVIFMTFKDVKPRSWEDCLAGMAHVLSEAYHEHRYLLTDGNLRPEDARFFNLILERRATKPDLVIALRRLSQVLAEHHREKVVILIDEYDSPIHAGYTNHYYDDVIAFFRDFLSGGLKDNEHVFKGVLTGILRVARESLFSGLNSIDVFSILRPELASYFGFTEPEVRSLVEDVGEPDLIDRIRSFYNGYLFGGEVIYNPWSVLSYLNRTEKELLPYWIDTSSNDLVRELLLTGPAGVNADLEVLLAGGTVEKRIDENIVLRDISGRSEALWSFLLFTGYLKPVEVRLDQGERWAKLAVPNAEVTIALRGMARDWIEARSGGSDRVAALLGGLLRGDAAAVEHHLSHMMLVDLSYFDATSPEPERFYHGLVVGLLASLGPRYEVRSNRESGLGRCDVMVLPREKGEPGVALELKRVGAGETPEKALRAALKQIRERDYVAELRARGAAPIHEMAAVFDGKRAHVRTAGEPRKTAPKPRAKAKAKATASKRRR
ncbi:MAG: AAA family ATPase [Minicystis sp.]